MGELANEPRIASFTLVKKGKKSGVEVTYENDYTGSAGETVYVKTPRQFHRVEPHADLVRAMALLSPHFSNIVELTEFNGKKCIDPKVVEKSANEFPVLSVFFRGGKGYTGVQLSGQRRLSTGDMLPLETRVVRFNEPNEPYDLKDELQEEVEAVKREVRALLGGKHAQPAQTTMALAAGGNDDGRAEE